ncbi:uncharacterized protein LOC143321284 isoform X2 [Chaetodon auriga]|uniref:uncharacterized protein LOC143321284 isoform X2 n=1 Tax=Chaetodon auriga TaxID=39042 RepID=UPI004032DD3D
MILPNGPRIFGTRTGAAECHSHGQLLGQHSQMLKTFSKGNQVIANQTHHAPLIDNNPPLLDSSLEEPMRLRGACLTTEQRPWRIQEDSSSSPERILTSSCLVRAVI